ncbi:GSCOCG00001588001-RA-CDS, partial [Cotesia congregata]
IQSLPVEILVEILSYLNSYDLHALEEVSTFFEQLVRQPPVWKTYEIFSQKLFPKNCIFYFFKFLHIKEHDPETYIIIAQLKRMPLLARISIETRSDCDDILRQLSRSNQKLEKLRIVDCTGSTGKLYLRSSYLTRILERCNRLHTIHILGSRFHGKKFYRLLGDMKTRLRTLSTQATSSQFLTFATYASHLNEQDREVICNMCVGGKTWAPLRYFMLQRPDYQRPLAPIRQ